MQLAAALRLANCNAAAAAHNGGSIRIYTADAADPDAAPTGTLLATLPLSATAFQAATDDGTNASAVANGITSDNAADNTGTAANYRTFNSSGTQLGKGTVTGTGGGGELQLNNTNLVQGGIVSVAGWTLRQPQG